MNWIKAMQTSIDYMEEHITAQMTIADIAAVASCSTFYYQRLFMMLTDMTVSQYIRNRRLTLAVGDLITGESRVIDVALKYGYESAEAFSRAFKKHHGFNPSEVGRTEKSVISFPKLTIQIQLKGAEPMEYRIEKKDGFKFYGMKRKFSTINGENFIKIPQFWDETMVNGNYETMLSYSSGESCLGVCLPMDPKLDTSFDYVIGAFCKDEVEGYDFFEVPKSNWAVFPVRGPIRPTLQNAWKRIFSEWFPGNNYEHANLPEMEVYYAGDPTSEDYLTEIWIPII